MRRYSLWLSIFMLFFTIGLAQESDLQKQLEGEVADYQSLLEERASELSSIEETLGTTANQLNEQIAQRDSLSEDLSSLKSEKKELEASLADLEAQLADTQSQTADLQDEIAQLKVRVEGILINMYKQRGGSFASTLSQAKNFHDLQVNNYYLSLLAEQDLALIMQLDTKAKDLATLQQEQSLQLANLDAKKTELSDNETSLVAKQDELKSLIGNLQSSQEGQLALRANLLKEQSNLENSISQAIEKLEQEKERLRREAEDKRRQAASAGTEAERQVLIAEAEKAETRLAALGAPLPALTSGYIYPIDSPTLVSRYKDIGSGVILTTELAGAAVRAINKGIVREMGFFSANDGYTVTIQHSESLSSSYVNLQATPLVDVGDVVEQGQIIGYLGGGTLTPPNALRFYMIKTNADGSFVAFTDPAGQLGF